ncbi:MAG: BBE domain-containing protein [Gammaproteobacteria bacterium]|nr:BBE domain-containing protein [Gammaproteobacteria bacterium]
MEPLTHGRYVNIASSDDHESHLAAAYGDNYPRLATLKKRYDPGNLFRLNANISRRDAQVSGRAHLRRLRRRPGSTHRLRG